MPTRRYHWPSALRPTSLRLELGPALELVGAGALLIDVRRHDDTTAPLPGAQRIMPDEIPSMLETLPRGSPIVLACT